MSFLFNKNVLFLIGISTLLFLAVLFSSNDTSEQDANKTPETPPTEKVVEISPILESFILKNTNPLKNKNSQQSYKENPSLETLTEYYPVIKVVDGDTLSILMNEQPQTIRLIGLDTPETVHPSKPVECYGLESSNKAKEILTGIDVRIEMDEAQGAYDKYNRLLAYVILRDGTNFNKFMIEKGYGYEYTYKLPYRYQDEFKLAQQLAETNKRGLWADDACLYETVAPVEKLSIIQLNKNTSNYICNYNAYNCSDFSTHDKAQRIYESVANKMSEVGPHSFV